MVLAAVLAVVVSGCSTPAAPARSLSIGSTQTATPNQTMAPIGSSSSDPECGEPADVEKLEVEQGATARTPLGIAVTYGGLEHDNFEGGSTDTFVMLTFQGILDDGRLTPSALTRRQPAVDGPRFVYLREMPLCVRVSNPLPKTVTLEIFRTPQRSGT